MANEGILADSEIQAEIRNGRISIDPFRDEQMNPASYDVTLGDQVAVYDAWVYQEKQSTRPEDGSFFQARPGLKAVDLKTFDLAATATTYKIDPEAGWVLRPGIGYLMHTRERVYTRSFVPVLDGKSTVGRLFITIHVTAGYGDPGFNGQFTLEVTAMHPVRVYPGMRIGQVRFHTLCGPVSKLYSETGTYRDTAAQGPVAANVPRLFR